MAISPDSRIVRSIHRPGKENFEVRIGDTVEWLPPTGDGRQQGVITGFGTKNDQGIFISNASWDYLYNITKVSHHGS